MKEHRIHVENPYSWLGEKRKREPFLRDCGVIRGILFAVCRERFINIFESDDYEQAIIHVKCTDEQYEKAKAIIREEDPDDYMKINFDWHDGFNGR